MINLIEYYNIPLWIVVIGLIIYNIFNYIKQRNLLKKHKKLQEKLDNITHKLDLQNHMSEYKFNMELKIYQELFDKMINAADYSSLLLPTLSDNTPANKSKELKLMHKYDDSFCHSYNAFTKVARKNEPFYKKDFYNKIDNIIQTMNKLHQLFKYKFFQPDMKNYAYHHITDASKFHKNIHKEINNLTDEVRNYINNLTKY